MKIVAAIVFGWVSLASAEKLTLSFAGGARGGAVSLFDSGWNPFDGAGASATGGWALDSGTQASSAGGAGTVTFAVPHDYSGGLTLAIYSFHTGSSGYFSAATLGEVLALVAGAESEALGYNPGASMVAAGGGADVAGAAEEVLNALRDAAIPVLVAGVGLGATLLMLGLLMKATRV